MTIKESIRELRSKGYRVSYTKRKDGGYLIKSINGTKFRGAKGNIQARSLLGISLSSARAYQLHRLNPTINDGWKRPKGGNKLPEALKKELRKVQQSWRKTHETIAGTISMSNLRYQYETYGEFSAYEKLAKAKKYAEGYAYEENVYWLRERITKVAIDILRSNPNLDVSGFDEIIMKLEDQDVVKNFREEWIAPMNEVYYRLTKIKGIISQSDINQTIREMKAIIG